MSAPINNQNTAIERASEIQTNNPLENESVKKLAKEVLDSLNCPVTLDLMQDPRTLKCGHSLDASSLESLRTEARNRFTAPKCTECRADISGDFPSSNITLKSLIDKISRLFALLGLGENLPASVPNIQAPAPVNLINEESVRDSYNKGRLEGYNRGRLDGYAKGVQDSRLSTQAATRVAIEQATRTGEIRGLVRGLEQGREQERQRAIAHAKANPSLFQRIKNYIFAIPTSLYNFGIRILNFLSSLLPPFFRKSSSTSYKF